MTKITTNAARKDLDALIDKAADEKERIAITRRGKKVVALVPIEDLDYLQELEDQIDADEVRKAREEMRRTGEKPVPWEEAKKRLGL